MWLTSCSSGRAPEVKSVQDSLSVLDYPTFVIPPPEPSAIAQIPNRIFLDGDSTTTLYEVADQLTSALNRARFGDRSFYLPQFNTEILDGFVLATQWEQIDEEGNPLPEPDRWAVKVTPNREWSLKSILEALLGPNTGYFRVMVFFVTPEYLGDSDETVNQETATSWTTEGASFLPPQVGNEKFAARDKAYFCTVYIYEFMQKTPDDQPVQRIEANGGLPARVHLEKSRLWTTLVEHAQWSN